MDGKLYIKKIIRDDGQQFEFDAQEIYLAEDNTLLVRPDPATTAVNYTEADGGEMISQQNLTYDQEINGLIIPKSTPYWDLTSKLSRFFQIRHNYKIIYIKKSGEMFAITHAWISKGLQILPVPGEEYSEWDITFTIGNTDWTEYAEDDSGEEIFSNSVQLPLIGAASGGEVWDEVGTVWTAEATGETSTQTATGTNIVLTDVAGNIQSLNNIYGNTEQTGTPTPSAPIPVNTVTGRQAVDINSTEYEINLGKNLLSLSGLANSTVGGVTMSYSDTKVVMNGATTGTGTLLLKPTKRLTLQPGTYTWTIWKSGAKTGGGDVAIYLRSDATTNICPSITGIDLAAENPVSRTFTITQPTDVYVRISSNAANQVFTNYEWKMNLEAGSGSTLYVPYIQAFGKNLFDKNNVLNGYRLASDGTDYADAAYSLSTYIKVLPNTTYTFTRGATSGDTFAGVSRYTADKTHVSRDLVRDASTTLTFTTNATTEYVRISDLTTNLGTIQLEQGSTATAYEPNISGQLELCKLGESQDYLYKDNGKWYLRKTTNRVNTSNTISVISQLTVDQKKRWGINFAALLPTYAGGDDMFSGLCSGLTASTRGRTYQKSQDNIIAPTDSTMAYGFFAVYASATESMQDADALNWFKTQAMDIYYPLATPLDIEITNADLLAQLEALGSASLSIPNSAIVVSSPYIAGEISIDYLAGITSGGEMWEIGEGGVQSIYINSTKTIYPEWVVKGPCVNPKLQNNTTDTFAEYDGTVAEGQTLTVNFAEGTAYLDTALVTRSLTGIVSFVPGENIVGFNSDGGSTSTSTISWDNIIS